MSLHLYPLALLAPSIALILAAPARAAEATGAPPSLVLMLAVDQLRRDRLVPELPGGLGRLVREGRVHSEGVLDHAITATCAGHVSMLTGRHPGPAGVPGNRFIDRESGETAYCVEDPAEDARVFGSQQGRSPRLIRVDTLGDWLKAARPGAAVYSVSGKDRAAIALGGRRPDGAYWYSKQGMVGFTTSRYYREALPDWVEAWNGADPAAKGVFAKLPDRWDHELGSMAEGLRPDDYPAESPDYGRTSGHPLRDPDLDRFREQVYASPYLDLLTLDFARELVRREGLGSDGTPDLLAVSLSATDSVGHLYGPESHEALDALLRIDAALDEFLDFLEGRTGEGGLVVALSADHGVLPLPERLAETGRNRCPVPGGRVGLRWLGISLLARLHWELDPLLSLPRSWLHFTGSQATVDRTLAKRRGVSVERVVEEAERRLEAEPAIREAWTEEEIRGGDGPLAQLYRNSFDPERSGDLAIQLEPTCLITSEDRGTTHGMPYAYDREVPILFFGPGFSAGTVGGSARTVDIAPTLAQRLGIETPPGLDGRPLSD
jgi:predicted AlkP superfamily pyrophosphatase or phosphodiesterase